MDRIDQWFERAARNQNRVVTLYPSLLRNRFASYFSYRLRYLFLLEMVAFAVHVAEFLILLAYAPDLGLIIVVLLRAGAPLVRGAWWGAMEVFRERLRGLAGPTRKAEYEQEIAHWLLLSAILAVAVVLCGVAWSATSQLGSAGTESSLVDIYILLITVELALRLPILTLHAGIYAIRRIYRPFAAVLASTLIQAALMAALFDSMHEGALIVSIVAGGAVGMTISLVYIKRMYRVVSVSPTFRQGFDGFLPFLRRLPSLALMWPTVAGLLIRIDGLLVLVLIGLEPLGGNSIDITAGHPTWLTPDFGIFLYVILPAIRGAYDWAGLFYFDFVRLRRSVMLRDLAHVFMAKLVFAAAGVALFFWGLAVIVFLIAFSDVPLAFLIAMVPLFLVRAWLSVYQIRAFADGRFAVVCASAIIAIGGVVMIGTHGYADIGSFMQVKICLLAALVFLIAAQLWDDRRTVAVAPFLSLNDWCRRLAAQTGDIELGLLTVAETTRVDKRSAIRAIVAEGLDGLGHCAWRDSVSLIYFQKLGGRDGPPFDPYEVVETAGGLMASVRQLPAIQKGGGQALVTLRETGLLPQPPSKLDLPALLETFRREFSDGIVLDLQSSGRSRVSAKLDRSAVATAIPLAMHALRSGSPFAWCGAHRLYATYLDQKLRALFFVPRDAEADSLSRWDDALAQWRLADAAASRAS